MPLGGSAEGGVGGSVTPRNSCVNVTPPPRTHTSCHLGFMVGADACFNSRTFHGASDGDAHLPRGRVRAEKGRVRDDRADLDSTPLSCAGCRQSGGCR